MHKFRMVQVTACCHKRSELLTETKPSCIPCVRLQDVPRSTDHAPSKTFYTFRANTDSAFTVMQHDIVHALLNLRLRHKHERDKQEDVSVYHPQNMRECPLHAKQCVMAQHVAD